MNRLSSKLINKLIARISNGDAAAMEKLFQYTCLNMKSVVLFYSSSKSNVEDILSELYYSIFKYANTFDMTQNGYNWMTQIAKNLCFRFNGKLEILASFNEDSFEDEAKLEIDQIIDRLFFTEAFKVLSMLEKQYILAVYWHGYTVKEIAKQRQLTVSSVYNILNNAYKKLKSFYKDV